MATDVAEKLEGANSCCNLWKEKYLKLQGNRSCLRQAVKVLEQQIHKIQQENLNLKKAYEEELARAGIEKQETVEEPVLRAPLESGIAALKSENPLNQKGGSNDQVTNRETSLLQNHIPEGETEINQLKELLQKERREASEWKKAESAIRASLETEIAALKSEICSLQLKGDSNAQDTTGDIKFLQIRISEGEKEINELKELLGKERRNAGLERKKAEAAVRVTLESEMRISKGEKKIKKLQEILEKEKSRANSECKKAEAEKKNAAEAWKIVKAEKSRADEERKFAYIEGKKAEEYRLQVEVLKEQADEARSKLLSVVKRFEDANEMLETEKQKVMGEKIRADAEKAKADQQRRLAEANRKKAVEVAYCASNLSQQSEEYKRRVEKLQKEIQELICSRNMIESSVDVSDKNIDAGTKRMNNRLLTEILKRKAIEFEVEKRRIEVETQVIKEKKYADTYKVKAEEQRILAEVNWKMAMEEKFRADQLSQHLEEAKQKIEELRKEIQDLVSSRQNMEMVIVPPVKDMNAESAKMKLLKKQLKFEKMKVKHAKKVAKLENDRNCILQSELGCLKLEFIQFSHRLDMLDKCFSPSAEDSNDLKKVVNFGNTQSLNLKRKSCDGEQYHMYLQPGNDLPRPCDTALEIPDVFKATKQCTSLLHPVSGNCSKSTSGIDFKLESLLGGPNRKMLQSSVINFNTSFSDRQLVGHRKEVTFLLPRPRKSTKVVEESLNLGPSMPRFSVEVIKMRCNENLAVVAENSVKSPLNNPIVEKCAGRSRKQKRMRDGVESIEYLYSVGKKLHLQMGDKLSILCGMLNKQICIPSEQEKCVDANMFGDSKARCLQFDKRKVSHKEKKGMLHSCKGDKQKSSKVVKSTHYEDVNAHRQSFELTTIITNQVCGKGITDSLMSIQDTAENCVVADGDYMKLLELNNDVDEELYMLALKRPLSPILPDIKFKAVETFDYGTSAVKESFSKELSNENEYILSSCCFNAIIGDVDSNRLECNTRGTSDNSLQHQDGGPSGFSYNLGNNVNCVGQVPDSGVEMERTNMSTAGDEGMKFQSESAFFFFFFDQRIKCISLRGTQAGGKMIQVQNALR